MKYFAILTSIALLVGAGGPATAQPVDPAPSGPVQIVSAVYGPPSAVRPHDFTERLTQFCGAGVSACETFCSRASIGGRTDGFRLPFSPRPICRVIYRCGGDLTKATEADEGETIILSCRSRG
jgi:hypothetical protein